MFAVLDTTIDGARFVGFLGLEPSPATPSISQSLSETVALNYFVFPQEGSVQAKALPSPRAFPNLLVKTRDKSLNYFLEN